MGKGGEVGVCLEEEEERPRIHAGNCIFETDVAQLVINIEIVKTKCLLLKI